MSSSGKSISVQRLEKRLLKLFADVTLRELKNPNIGFVTFISCNLSRDGSQLVVKVSIYEEDEIEKKRCFQALKTSASFYRAKIKAVMSLRVIPKVIFELDHSIEILDEQPIISEQQE